jgi:hypothetical protein
MKTLWLFAVLLAVTGCSTYNAGRPFPLVEADPISVRGCRPVGRFAGPSGYRFWGPPPVLGDFKYRAAVQAREAGAIHIYWRDDFWGYYGQSRVVGHAFDCTGVAMPGYDDLDAY